MDQFTWATKFGISDKESVKYNLSLVVIDGFILCVCYNHKCELM